MGETTTASIKSLKPGQYVMVDGDICKVSRVDISKSGKHGAAKARLEATSITDGKQKSIVKPGDTDVEVPIILKKTAQVLAFIGENVQVMDLQDFSTFELPIPSELKGKVKEGGEVLYWEIGSKKILREAKS